MNDSCQRFKDMVSDFIEGELDHQNQSLMEKHLRNCLDCKKNISQLKTLIQRLRELPRITVSPDFETILRARISMESSLARHRRERWFPIGQYRLPASVFAAVIVVFALFTVFVLNKSNRYSAPQADINNQWYKGEGVEKVDPYTNERYIYIFETQQVPNVNYQIPGENYQSIDRNVKSDSIHTIKDSNLKFETVSASESKIY
jgi:hypothetical protein